MASFLNEHLFTGLSEKKQTLLRALFGDSEISAQGRWYRITTEILEPTVPFAVHLELYKLNYASFHDYESPAWFPNNHVIKNKTSSITVSKKNKLHSRMTNIERIMKSKCFTTYSQFYDWSVGMESCEEYWDTCIKAVGVQFESPYSKIFDYSATAPATTAGATDPHYGVKSVCYLPDARFNIADSCFPKEYLEDCESDTNIPPAVVFASDSNSTLQYYSHRELNLFSNQVALALSTNFDLKVGDAVGICMPMTPESIALYIGIIKAGFAVVSIADSFSAIEIATRMKLSNAKVIVTQDVIGRGDKILPLYTRVLEAQPGNVVVVPYSASRNIDPSVVLRQSSNGEGKIIDANIFDLLQPMDSEMVRNYKSVVRGSQDVCNILFSSGTTGEPKAIPWYHCTPIKSAIDGHIHQDIQEGDVVCWPTNLGWMMGPWILFQLVNKGTIAIYNGVSTTFGFMQFVQDAKVTMLGVVPSIVKAWKNVTEKQTALLKEKARKEADTRERTGSADLAQPSVTPSDYYWPFDWTHVTKFSSTGEASDLESMLWLMSRVGTIAGPDGVGSGYAPVIEYCGGTEIAGSFLSSTLLQPNIPSLMSSPVCGSRVCILNDSGDVVYSDVDVSVRRASCIIQDGVSDEDKQDRDEREMTGEIALIPPSLGLSTMLLNRVHHECYYDEMPLHQDGRLLRRHGDEIQNLPGSYFRALGRCDDTMNLGGIKVSSVEIERVCNISSPTIIAETAAIAIRPRDGGPSMLVLVVVTKPMTSGIVIDNNTTGAMLHDQETEFKNKVKSTCQGAIKTKLNPLFHIYDVVLVTELPRTASNKIMRRVLRDNYMAKWGK